MRKIAYQDCEVLRITPWTDDKLILTLLSKEQSLFSALYKVPQKTRRLEKDNFPNLFQSIQGALQFHPEGKHKLRDFDVTETPQPLSLQRYGGLCLLSRILQLTLAEHHADPQGYSLWKQQQLGEFDLSHWTEILCDLHFIWGTWPSGQYCEICGETQSSLGFREKWITCSKCHPSAEMLSQHLLAWLKFRYRKPKGLALDPKDAKLLRRYLWRRLPDQIHGDLIFRRLNRDHFKAPC